MKGSRSTTGEAADKTAARADSLHGRRGAAVAALMGALQRADPGTLAALRRGRPTSPPPAFFRLATGVLDDYAEPGLSRDELETRWAVVVQAMAGAIDLLGRVPLGEALARAGVAEMRVLRLLQAHDETLADCVRQVVHQLSSKGQIFTPYDLADLVLTDLTRHAEHARRHIARNYYRHEGADRRPQ